MNNLPPGHLPTHKFYLKLAKNLIIGISTIALSLIGGMFGYHHFENMSWVDSYVNAAMILSGMGPLKELHTEDGKIFAGTYALFSGIIFLVVIAFIFTPVLHRFFHQFHIDESKK